MQSARGPRKLSTTLSASEKPPIEQQLAEALGQILTLKQQNALLMQQLEQTVLLSLRSTTTANSMRSRRRPFVC